MQAGKLRHEITIQSLTRTADEMGGGVDSWATFTTSWASIEPAGSKERWFGQQIEANVTHRVRIRKQDGVTTKMRVLFGSRVFQIRGVQDFEERGIFLDLLCEEGVQS